MTDLTDGGAGAQGLLERIEDVVRPLRGGFDRVQAAGHLGVVAVGSQCGQPGGLVGLDRRVHPQRLVAVLLLGPEPVDADHGPRAVLDALQDRVRRVLDLALLVALLDRGDRSPALFDLFHQFTGGVLDLVGQRLDRVGAGERVDGGGDVRLVGEDLLGAQRQRRGLDRG